MTDIKKTFELIDNLPGGKENKRFLTVQTGRNDVATVDLETVHHVEINGTQIWIGDSVFIKHPETGYKDTLEELYSKIVETWIRYKEYPLK